MCLDTPRHGVDMDILSPAYQPAEGVTGTIAIDDDLDELDAEGTSSRLAERADAASEVRAAIDDIRRAMHELQRDLLVDDYEVVLAATYTLTDLAEQLTSLRFRLELAI